MGTKHARVHITLPHVYSDAFTALWAGEVRVSYPEATVSVGEGFEITATTEGGNQYRAIEEAIGWGYQIRRDALQEESKR